MPGEMATEPAMNGYGNVNGDGKYIDSIDPDDPLYIREMRRPAEVKEDVKQMEHRQRVSLILKSKQFRDELENIVTEYATTEMGMASHGSIEAIRQQISDMILPPNRFESKAGITKAAVAGAIIPISDMRGVSAQNYSKGERMLRCKLASCYRLLDLFGWVDGLHNHITSRISQEYEHFLTAPHGLMYHEVSASSLLKVEMNGDVVDVGSTTLGLDREEFAIHAAIHAFRPDIKAIIHLRTPSVVAVSSMKCGLLPVCYEAIVLGDVAQFEYEGPLQSEEEKDRLAKTLGPSRRVMLLRNHGVLVGGESIEDAFQLAHTLTQACHTQVQLMPIGLDNINIPSEEVRRRTLEAHEASFSAESATGEAPEGSRRRWRRGEKEFEALMRHLDNAGFRSGHLFHEPNIRRGGQRERINQDVEVPPSASSLGQYWDDENKSPIKGALDTRKKGFRNEWLNTPNAYVKEEVEERGTPNPKKIAKWVPGGEDPTLGHATPVRLQTANTFAPQGANPYELRQKCKEIRQEYYEEKISAGPQSRILEGMTWEEAQRAKEAGADGHVSGVSETMVVVGAASKGIIQRDHQHNVGSYTQFYSANPFESMSEEEMDQYKRDIENKAKGVTAESNTATTTSYTTGPDGRLQESTTTTVTTVTPGPDGQLVTSEECVTSVRAGDQQTVHITTTEYPRAQYLETSLDDDASVASQNGDDPGSPTKSTSSAEPGSPSKEAQAPEGSPTKEKKKKFRMPSFSKKKKEKK